MRWRKKGFAGAAKVYGWSAYSQGSGENRNADADAFMARALKFFGHGIDAKPITDPVERGRTLARLIRKQRTLLVLDGLEPMQDLPEINEGRLKDRGLQALVTQLATENPGLVIITSRQELPELAKFVKPAEAGKPADVRVINHALDNLDERAGADLLKHLGVHGRETELMAAVREVGGHALSVSLLGTYLSAVCAGDVARRDTLRFFDLVDHEGETAHDRQAKRATRIMDAYVERFEKLPLGEVETERMILSLVGLFDRPAERDAIDAVLAAPAIAGLTEGWHALPLHEQALSWSFALKRLRALKLIASPSPRASSARGEGRGGGQLQTAAQAAAPHPNPLPTEEWGEGADGLDAHPVVRQHFGRLLKEGAPDTFREANRRLYEHYKALPSRLYGKELPDTLEEMQPLFAAIAHGCAAGLHQEVFDEVFYVRVRRGDEAYINSQLGAFSANLYALVHFFDPPWIRPSPSLVAHNQVVVLNYAGFALRALGRLREAVEPIRENVRLNASASAASRYTWREAATNASNLSELLLTLGDVRLAVAAARESVDYADKSGDASARITARTTLADALHRADDTRTAEALFAEAERLQKQMQPDFPRLYSLRGYQFCDLLLGQARHGKVAEHAVWTRDFYQSLGDQVVLLDRALLSLSFGRAMHQNWLEGGAKVAPCDARNQFDAAAEGLRKAGSEDRIPNGLLARAAFRRDIGEWDKVQEDLDEANEIASRGGMRLHLTNYHLESARLRLAQIPGVRPPDEWTLALARAAAPTEPKPKGVVARVMSWFRSSTAVPAVKPPAPTDADRVRVREAREEWAKADALVRATGYHRRDGELQALRALLDALAKAG
jgi:tetratricopeptide (TPR) repeat protein